MLGAIAIQKLLAAYAQVGLRAVFRIVDPSVDDFGIAAADFLADTRMPFQEHDLTTRPGQRARAGKPDDASTDNDTVDAFKQAKLPGL